MQEFLAGEDGERRVGSGGNKDEGDGSERSGFGPGGRPGDTENGPDEARGGEEDDGR